MIGEVDPDLGGLVGTCCFFPSILSILKLVDILMLFVLLMLILDMS